MNDNILEPHFNGLPKPTDWKKVIVPLQQANEKEMRGATLNELGDEMLKDKTINGQRMKAVPPGALPAGPEDREMYMELLSEGTWTWNGVAVATNPKGSILNLWWNKLIWSKEDGVGLPVAHSVDVVEEGNLNAVQSDAVAKSIKPFGEVIETDFVESGVIIIPTTTYILFNNPNIKGHGQNVGVKKNFGGITISIRPTYSAANVPTFVEVIVRKGGVWNGAIISRSKVTQPFPFDVKTDTYFALDTFVANDEEEELFISFIGNGLIGAYGPSVTNPYGKQFYTYESGGETTPFEGGSGQLGMTFHTGEVKTVINDDSIAYVASKLNLNPFETPSLLLNSKTYLMPSTEYNIFNDNVCVPEYGDNNENYRLDFVGNIGKQYNRGFRLNSVPPSLDNTIALLLRKGREQLKMATQNLLSAALNNGSGITRDVLYWGDSTAAGDGLITIPLTNIFSGSEVMRISCKGTQGAIGTKHESKGGWKIEDTYGKGPTYYRINVAGIVINPTKGARYTQGVNVYNVEETNITAGTGYFSVSVVSGTAPSATGILTKTAGTGDPVINYASRDLTDANKAYNPAKGKFDFAYYLSNTGQTLSSNGWIIFQLGINDIFNYSNLGLVQQKVNTMIIQMNEIIASIHEYDSTIRIGIVITFPPSDQNGFGESYSLDQTAEMYTKTGLVTWQNKLIQEYDNETSRDSRIYLIPAHLNLDTLNNYPTWVRPVNSRNTNTIVMQNNGVHPDTSGSAQIADMVAGVIKYFG